MVLDYFNSKFSEPLEVQVDLTDQVVFVLLAGMLDIYLLSQKIYLARQSASTQALKAATERTERKVRAVEPAAYL
jgi:hypothetical protein